MSVTTFRLPDLGEGLAEAELVAWHVAEGDRVVADQPLLSVETDKAVVEIPSPASGTVVALHARPGARLGTGAPLADLDAAPRPDAGAIVGRLETPGARPAAARRAESAGGEAPLRAVPAARVRAREVGLDLRSVAATGPGGCVTCADVERAAATRQLQAAGGASPAPAGPGLTGGPASSPDRPAEDAAPPGGAAADAADSGGAAPSAVDGGSGAALGGRSRPEGAGPGTTSPEVRADAAGGHPDAPRGAGSAGDAGPQGDDPRGGEPAPLAAPGEAARRSMARAMARAGARVVPATVTEVADVTAWFVPERDVTARLVRALCAAARAEPALNGQLGPDGESRALTPRVSPAIAIDTPRGLYAPVLHEADRLGPAEIRAALDRLIADTHARSLPTGAFEGATITLSNFGTLGGRHAVLVVTPPQIAALGAGRIYQGVGWQGAMPVPRAHLPLSLTFDHRAATGGEAARFLAALRAALERPDPAREAP